MLQILVTDDHAVIRQGLKQILLDGFGKVDVSEAQNAHEALEQIWKKELDAVVMDITMPGRSGLDIFREIKSARPKLPVLFLSMHEEDQFAVRALKAGAAGFISKECAPHELVNAVKKILAGGKYVSNSLAQKLAVDLATDSSKPLHESLSNREFEVMCLIASGKSATQIAQQLAPSVKTVSTYRARILVKMKMKTNADLTHYAIKNNLVD